MCFIVSGTSGNPQGRLANPWAKLSEALFSFKVPGQEENYSARPSLLTHKQHCYILMLIGIVL